MVRQLGLRTAVLKPLWSPRQLPGLKLWLAGNRSPITLNSGNISQWDDLSGNGSHVTQATATKQPVRTRSDNRQNELPWSEAFEGAGWTSQNGLTRLDNQIANPLDGSLTMAKVTSDGTTGGRIFQSWDEHRNGQFVEWAYFKDGTAPTTGSLSVSRATDYTVNVDSTGSETFADGSVLRWNIVTLSGGGTFYQVLLYPCSNGWGAIGAGEYGYVYGAGIAPGNTFPGYAPTTDTLAYPGVNGHPGARFDETDDSLQSSVAWNNDNLFAETQKTAIVAFKTGENSMTNRRIFIGVKGLASSFGLYIVTGNRANYRYRNSTPANANMNGSILSANTTYVMAIRQDGAAVNGYLNSLTAEATAADGYTSAETSTDKADIGVGSGLTILEGVAVAGNALTDDQFNQTMRYLANKYGITLS